MILEDQFTSPCQLFLDHKVLENCRRLAFCKQSVMYHVKSINLVTTTVHEVTVKNGLLTDIRYYLLITC